MPRAEFSTTYNATTLGNTSGGCFVISRSPVQSRRVAPESEGLNRRLAVTGLASGFLAATALVEQSRVADLILVGLSLALHIAHASARSRAQIQLISFAIAFEITSCSFIIRYAVREGWQYARYDSMPRHRAWAC